MLRDPRLAAMRFLMETDAAVQARFLNEDRGGIGNGQCTVCLRFCYGLVSLGIRPR